MWKQKPTERRVATSLAAVPGHRRSSGRVQGPAVIGHSEAEGREEHYDSGDMIFSVRALIMLCKSFCAGDFFEVFEHFREIEPLTIQGFVGLNYVTYRMCEIKLFRYFGGKQFGYCCKTSQQVQFGQHLWSGWKCFGRKSQNILWMEWDGKIMKLLSQNKL